MSASTSGGMSPELSFIVSRFDSAKPAGPAYGTMQETTWAAFTASFSERREGLKDGHSFVPAHFKEEREGRVRRLKEHLVARTAMALDCETSPVTAEVPPPIKDIVQRVEATQWAAVVYTSHNHRDAAPRYRIVLPLSDEISATLPAVEVVADRLGVLGVLDSSKLGAASLFYFPSCAPGQTAQHSTVTIDGDAIDATWLQKRAGAMRAAREAEQTRQRAAALDAAERRRKARVDAGFNPSESIIEAVRQRLDLTSELLRHGYTEAGTDRFLFPGSKTGIPGVYLMRGRDGVERVFSHHSADPLAASNLPTWCQAKAIDVLDIAAILDHGGDFTKALATLAKRFGIETKRVIAKTPDPRRKAAARAACRMIRAGMTSDAILARLHQMNAEQRDPLPPDAIRQTAIWAARVAGGTHAAR